MNTELIAVTGQTIGESEINAVDPTMPELPQNYSQALRALVNEIEARDKDKITYSESIDILRYEADQQVTKIAKLTASSKITKLVKNVAVIIAPTIVGACIGLIIMASYSPKVWMLLH